MSRQIRSKRQGFRRWSVRLCAAAILAGSAGTRWVEAQVGNAGSPLASTAPARVSSELRQGRALLTEKKFAAAKAVFESYLQGHPKDVQAELGLGDAQLGLNEFEAAEASYRAVVAQQPELWQAHKNLVVVEAALGRWEDFDGERKLLRLARERGAPGISPRESDVIDSLNVHGERWVVRAYFEPMGRSEAVYNFERFSPEGRVLGYISLEDAAAAQAALKPGDERIGASTAGGSSAHEALALNWYTGEGHGTIARYANGEPSYERVRTDMLRWLKTHQM